jgi:hypothetical protein
MATKKDIFAEHLEDYLKASKKRKGGILDHVCFARQPCVNSSISR